MDSINFLYLAKGCRKLEYFSSLLETEKESVACYQISAGSSLIVHHDNDFSAAFLSCVSVSVRYWLPLVVAGDSSTL